MGYDKFATFKKQLAMSWIEYKIKVLALAWQNGPQMGMVRVMWDILEFLGPHHIFGLDEARQIQNDRDEYWHVQLDRLSLHGVC